MGKQIFEAKWKCPICKTIGNRWLIVRNARKNGRSHIRHFHNIRNLDPIIQKRRIKENDKN